MSYSYEMLVKRVTLISVSVSIFLIIIKLITCWLTGSLSLLASLVDSSIDLLASTLNYFLVRYALKPPDEDHAFGHGKAESLAALAQSTFIIGSAIILLITSIKSFFHPTAIQFPLLGISISAVSVLITGGLVCYQKRIVNLTGSQAVRADMLHYSADLLMNIAVIIALSLSAYSIGFADALFAFLIALYILYVACVIAFQSIQDLLDKALPEGDNTKMIEIAYSMTDVKGVHALKTRQAGRVKFIQMHIELADDIPLIRAHAIADNIEQRISQEFAPAEVIIHQDPVSVVPQEIKREVKIP